MTRHSHRPPPSRAFYHFYQPIFHLHKEQLYGCEALIRHPGHAPDSLFQKARADNVLYELDMLSIYYGSLGYMHPKLSSDSLLFVNIFPSTMVHPLFLEQLSTIMTNAAVPPGRMILEISETEPIGDSVHFNEILAILRKMGFRLAMDDIGKGVTSFSHFYKLEPEIMKLDTLFSRGLSQSPQKQKMIQRLLDFCSKDVLLVLEGIEQEEDLYAAKELGVSWGQGYLLGKPNHLKDTLILKKV